MKKKADIKLIHLDRGEVDGDGLCDRVGDEAGDGDRTATGVEQGHLQADRPPVGRQLTKVQDFLQNYQVKIIKIEPMDFISNIFFTVKSRWQGIDWPLKCSD